MSSPDQWLLPSSRLRYYNPKLDPRLIAEKMTPAMAHAVENCTYDDDGNEAAGGPLQKPSSVYPCNLISSLCEDGLHRPALDLDMPQTQWHHQLTNCFRGQCLVPVRSSSNWHVYIPGIAYTTGDYFNMISHLADIGLIEDAYLRASIGRGQTLLRPPHIRKLNRPIPTPVTV